MKNVLTINLADYPMTPRMCRSILANARISQERGFDGPTLGKDTMSPTIQYNPSADSYIFIEGYDVSEMDHDAAVDKIMGYRQG